ncbi:MAG: hypothetical protein ACI9NC_002311 [Verrucomicrobiales bacterium]|jgi:hypothetical protein
MKISILLGLLVAASSVHALDQRHTSISSDEITGYGDFDNDGRLDVLLIERSTGSYRIGEQNADGTLSWASSRPSGMSEPSELAVGVLGQLGELSFALVNPDANRVQIIVPGSNAATQADSHAVFPAGIGPSSVAAVDLNYAGDNPAQADLVVITSDPNNDRSLFKNTGGVQIEDSHQALAAAESRARSVWLKAGGVAKGYAALRDVGQASELVVHGLNDPAQFGLIDSLGTFSTGADYINASFDGGANQSFVVFTEGKSTIVAAPFDSISGFGADVEHDLGSEIRHLSLFANVAGDHGLFVVFENGDAVFYDFDGVNPPVIDQTISPSPGERINGAAGFGNGLIAVLAGPVAGGASTVAHRFTDDFGGWTLKDSTTLPGVTAMSALGNLAIYDADPMIHEGANVIEIMQFSDWTSSPSINPNLQVTVETISSASGGLGGGSVIAVGAAPVGAMAALSNQPRPDMSVSILQSVLGERLPALSIDPSPGVYDSYVTPEILVRTAGHSAYYRTTAGGAWLLANGPIDSPQATLIPFTVEYFAEDPVSGRRSPIHHASYSYSLAPAELDSDHDGVPDFVEIANNLNPVGGADTDGDGFSDLEEILLETDPLDAQGKPAAGSHLAFNSIVDLAIQPRSLPMVGGSLALSRSQTPFSTPTRVEARDLDGSLLGVADTAENVFPKLASPNALIEDVTPPLQDLFLLVGTQSVFDTQAGKNKGHELIRLLKSVFSEATSVDWEPSGGTLAVEASAWEVAARSQFLGVSDPLRLRTLDYKDSLALLLMERFLIREFKTRAVAPNAELDTLSLTEYRDSDQALWTVTREALLQLQMPGAGGAWLLHDVYDEIVDCLATPPNQDVADLVKLAGELYRASGEHSAAEPGNFPAPFDLLRKIVRGSGAIDLPGGYADRVEMVPFELASAAGGAAFVMSKPSNRSMSFLNLVIAADGTLTDSFSGAAVELFGADGKPFVSGAVFDLLEGTTLSIQAFSDRGFNEVVSSQILSLPQPGANDSDGNLLDDDFEIQYFGGIGNNPFADPDGDGYSSLQESFEATSPISSVDAPAVAIEELRPPAGSLESEGVNLAIRFDWPGVYENRIGFRIDHSIDLGSTKPWTATQSEAFFEGGDRFTAFIFPDGEVERDFYIISMYLK